MMIKPFSGKASIQTTNNQYNIEIPASKNWLFIFFISAWLCGWAMGWSFAFSTIIKNSFSSPSGIELFLIFWLIGWTVGGFLAIKTLVWMISGKEIITFNKHQLKIQRKGDWLSTIKIYDLRNAHEFKISTSLPLKDYPYHNYQMWDNLEKKGKIQFDYGMQTIRFGIGIDEAEGRYILDQLQSKGFIN